ncbi:ATP-dependent nuclease [Pseudomonas sp. 6D_7.1_Bac1]|uniref:ATP-dependent nuclease n=1 Tax=Pseudomonas sp. 6D_7.1_Bac1 TaxID=2971615 RepID=UPI0021C755B7|nr:AAA family ATPase [Pseudomonas sp. 6D_7.1_Bac1]MCU1748558.1 AAA family ATPase [Pseudomonas sp. 6D_7.1_Bac1]
MHIKSIGFKSIRRLNANIQDQHVNYDKAVEHMRGLELATVNLLIGENGTGKSTVIDMIRALRWPDVLPSLARDNPEYGCTPEFCIELKDGRAYLYRFTPSPLDETFQKVICKMGYRPAGGEFEKIAQKLLDRFTEHPADGKIPPAEGVQIEYLNCGGPSLNVDAQALEHLNAHAELLTGMIDWKHYAEPTRVPLDGNVINAREDGVASTWLSNQDDLGQSRMDMPNNVKASWYPSGWKACAAILHWLSNVQDDSICLLEEPEVHMHPKLQRRMFERVLQIAKKKTLQLVISTHSAALINAAVSSDIKIFQAQGQKIAEANIAEVLDRLGYQAADLLQANCVIWVEGPSDRMYLNSWLRAKNSSLKEGLHYSIMFYGGRLFSHLTASETALDDLISLRRLNRNSAIVFDSDKAGPDAVLTDTKRRLQAEFTAGNGLAWVTEGREIENYLDEAALRVSLKQVHPSMVRSVGSGMWANLLKYEVDAELSKAKKPDPERTGNKVDVASHYLKHNRVNLKVLDLEQRLDELCAFINACNT